MAKFPNIEEIRGLADTDLQDRIRKIRREIFDLRTQAVTEKLQDTSLLTQGRRAIARIKTVLRERELAAQQKVTAGAGK